MANSCARTNHFYQLMNSVCLEKLILIGTRTLGLILIYYCFSIGITFYQKWFIKGFHYPLTVVVCHLIIKFILSSWLRFIYKYVTGIPRITLSWHVYVRRVALIGITSALDIGFSNWSFEFITISLYTMTKSTCIIFILGFAILFGLEKKRFSLIIIVMLISLGLFMFTYKSTQFQLDGFLLVLSASILGGLRWTLAQLVMQRKDIGLSNPVDMMYHVQPWMLAGLIPLAVLFEAIPFYQDKEAYSYLMNLDAVMLYTYIFFILMGAVLAFLMELSEYLLLTYTSSLTLSIAGIFKEVFTLYLAVNFDGDQMSLFNFIGLMLCLFGITFHVTIKAIDTTAQDDCKKAKSEEIESERLLVGDEEDIIFDMKPVGAKLNLH